MHFKLFHTVFEDGLFISVLENKATRHENVQQESEISKKVKCGQRPPAQFIFRSPF
jgi:hypothetical protein